MQNWLQRQTTHLAKFSSKIKPGRIILFCLGLILFWWLLLVRLVDIQLVRGGEFHQQADDNRYFTLRIPPERGVFFDRYGELLTWNQRRYFAVDDPAAIQGEWQPLEREEALHLLATQSARVRYSWQRQYALSSALAHVLGYIGPVTAEDLLADGTLTVSDQVGKSGLELVFDDQLQGQAGSQVYEIDSMGQRQRLVEENPGKPGQNFATSLDPYLSQLAADALGDQQGTVIIMSADDGQILSLINQPSFDLNLFAQESLSSSREQLRQEKLEELFADERQVFFNRGISGVYPPGSIFKLVTSLAGLETGAINVGTSVLDEGVLRVGDYEYRNWYYTQYGRTEGEISLVRALARSNDIYFYKAAEWTGPNKLAEFSHLLGLGEKTGIELNAEATGLIPTPSWKEQTLGEPWYLGNTYHMGIGQGNILTSPLQIAQLTQAVANDGELCAARLIDSTQPVESSSTESVGQEQNCAQLSLAPENLDLVMNGLLDACSPGGTAYPFFAHNQQLLSGQEELSYEKQLEAGAVACKTGTAEFGAADEEGHRPTHGWFTLIFDTEQIQSQSSQSVDSNHINWLKLIQETPLPKRLVITVLVESDEEEPFKEGSEHAAEVAKTIVDWMYGR